MEFSFDRSKEHLRKPENNSVPPSRPDLSASEVRPGPDLNSVDPSTIANDRLRKAIERNRAKQAGRAEPPKPAGGMNFTQAQAEQYHQQNSLFSRPSQSEQSQQKEQPATVAQEEAQGREMPRARERLSARLNTATRQSARDAMRETAAAPEMESAVVSRRSVAKPEDTEFVPVKRTPKKVASQISYTTNSTRKKSKSLDPKYLTWLVKGSWIFCGIMVLRLIFAAGGVTDFYSQKSTMNEKVGELGDIKKENMQLVRDIERMKTDIGFQKKLVRDNLGFIASDEFLVLFPKE